MNHILDIMFCKRFCLPSNIDLDEFKNNNMSINNDLGFGTNHVNNNMDI